MVLYELVGRVIGLFRYPVKTMLGEEIQKTYVTRDGIIGDRAYAVELEGEKIDQGKNPVKYAKLVMFKARYLHEPRIGITPPAVIETPSGREIRTDDGNIDRLLSGELGTSAHLVKSSGKPFHDSHPIHIITTATLEYMRGKTGQDFIHRRFRPSILIEPVENMYGLLEDEWVGATLRIGDWVELFVRKRCRRCFFTTLAQPPGVPKNASILRFVEEINGGNLGVNCLVVREGVAHVGDAVKLVNRQQSLLSS